MLTSNAAGPASAPSTTCAGTQDKAAEMLAGTAFPGEPVSAVSSAKPSGAQGVTVIDPMPAPFAGAIRVPGDKSISHRAVLFSAMAEGVSRVSGVLDSADVRSTIGAVRALGAKVDLRKQPDGSLAGTVEGWGSRGPAQPDASIDCGNSGTTVRLLMGVLAPWDVAVELTGDDSLCRRPMRRITAPLEAMGARFSPEGAQTLPLTVRGTRSLSSLTYVSPVASAQLKTAVLLAGSQAEGLTRLTEPAPSRNHTELMLPAFGVPVEAHGLTAQVKGPCALHASDVAVPGDPSSAAFPLCAAALLPGSDVTVEGMSLNPARIGFVRVLKRMGAHVTVSGEPVASFFSRETEPCGSVSVRYAPDLRACEVAPDEIASLVDEIPVLALVAASAQGTTVFRGAGELRVKETDRFRAIIDGLSLIGVRAWGEGDDLHVEGHGRLQVPKGTVFDSLGDHRLAMTWALAGMAGSVPVGVKRFESVGISYPQFSQDMQRLAK